MTTDHERRITRARALWSRTGSSNPHEAETARRLLDRYLKRHSLSMADLGERPYKDATPAPPRTRPQAPSRPTPTPNYTAGPASGIPVWAAELLRQQVGAMFRQAPPRFDPSPYFRTTTLLPIDRRRYGDRIKEPGSVYKIHWFREQDLFACVGRAASTTHTYCGYYGPKWDKLLQDHAKDGRPLDLLEYVQNNLKDTTYRVRTAPYPSITELAGEREQDWIELDPDTFLAMSYFRPDALRIMAQSIVQAARQFEAETPRRPL